MSQLSQTAVIVRDVVGYFLLRLGPAPSLGLRGFLLATLTTESWRGN
jgi:hypothetical protein